MAMCSWLQEEQMVVELGDWETAYEKYYYIFILSWIAIL